MFRKCSKYVHLSSTGRSGIAWSLANCCIRIDILAWSSKVIVSINIIFPRRRLK